MNKLLSVLVLVLGVQAKAGVLIEPFLGYDQTTLKNTDLSGTNSGATDSGTDYGARLGYRFNQGFWLAAEYTGGSGKSKSDIVGTADQDYTKTALGAVIGYDSGRFRFWGGYGFSDKITFKQTGSTDTDAAGTNLKVGLGFIAANHVSVNLEYIIPKYTKLTSSGVEYDVATLYSKFDTSGAMLSVSFPFDLTK